MENKPAFSFVGYHLEKIDYIRNENEQANEILFSIESTNYDSEHKFLVIESKLEIKFETSTSTFIFTSGYNINTKILTSEEEIEKSLPFLMSSVFPYIRTQIHNITSDSRDPIIIPTLDLRGISVRDGISLKKKYGRKK